MPNILKKIMPNIMLHEGIWEGTYRHIDQDGATIDFHKSRIECIFPEDGEVVYLQRNTFTWEDGKEYKVEFPGVLVGEKIYWDTDTFSGHGWMSGDNMFCLELDRKDDVGARFHEVIVMGENNDQRVRTWHWFKNGACFKRTLCNEVKVK